MIVNIYFLSYFDIFADFNDYYLVNIKSFLIINILECYTKFIIWIIIIQSAVKKILYVNPIRISVSIRIIRPGYKSGSIRMKSGFFFCVIRMTVFIRIEALGSSSMSFRIKLSVK